MNFHYYFKKVENMLIRLNAFKFKHLNIKIKFCGIIMRQVRQS